MPGPFAIMLAQIAAQKLMEELGPDDKEKKEKRQINTPDITAITASLQSQGPQPIQGAGVSPLVDPLATAGGSIFPKSDTPLAGGKFEKFNQFADSPLGDLTTGTLGAIPGAISASKAAKDAKESRKKSEKRAKRRDRIQQGDMNTQNLLALAAALNGLMRPGGF